MEEFDVDEMQGLAPLYHTCTPVIRKNLLTRVSLFKESNLESSRRWIRVWGYRGYKGMSELKGVLIEGMLITYASSQSLFILLNRFE